MKIGTTSAYHGVTKTKRTQGKMSKIRATNRKPFIASMMSNGIQWTGPYRETEREAAIDYDRRVIELGLDRPLNILKRKSA